MKKIWVVREAVGYNNDELGSASTVAHTADRLLFAAVWPHILANEMNAVCEMAAKRWISKRSVRRAISWSTSLHCAHKLRLF